MKTIKSILAIFALLNFTFPVQAQDKGKNTDEIKIKTSSVCNMCKKTI